MKQQLGPTDPHTCQAMPGNPTDPKCFTCHRPMNGAPRPLHVIADDIADHWPAIPARMVDYVRAMRALSTLEDVFVTLTGEQVVRSFLSQTTRTRWRSTPDGRRLILELRAMLGSLTTEQDERG